jgi:hypothetical protein
MIRSEAQRAGCFPTAPESQKNNEPVIEVYQWRNQSVLFPKETLRDDIRYEKEVSL